MSNPNERGARSERSSALWGTGGRGGDRSSVLWGQGGRGMVVTLVLGVALMAPLAATAGNGKGSGKTPAPASDPAPNASNGNDNTNFVAPSLLDKAKNTPNGKIDVIIMSSGGLDASKNVSKWLAKLADKAGDVQSGRDLGLVGAVTASLPAKLVSKLQGIPGLTVVPDAPVKLAAQSTIKSSQIWPYESGNSDMWAGDQALYAGKLPTIAVVDSGIQNRADFGTRLLASVNLSTLDGNSSMDDQRGHGTFVGGIAAGAASDLAGAAPTAPLVSIKVMDSTGIAKTSDVINACQWILDNKSKYNIRVAN